MFTDSALPDHLIQDFQLRRLLHQHPPELPDAVHSPRHFVVLQPRIERTKGRWIKRYLRQVRVVDQQ